MPFGYYPSYGYRRYGHPYPLGFGMSLPVGLPMGMGIPVGMVLPLIHPGGMMPVPVPVPVGVGMNPGYGMGMGMGGGMGVGGGYTMSTPAYGVPIQVSFLLS